MSNIGKSQDVIKAIADDIVETDGHPKGVANSIAYAKAFGFAWAILSNDQREMMLEHYLGTAKTLEL